MMPPPLRHPRLRAPLVLVLPLLASAGCHLYDAGNHAAAQSAQTSFRDAKIAASLDAERALSREMSKAELAAARADVEARRDQSLVQILDAPWSEFAGQVNAQTARLTGQTDPVKGLDEVTKLTKASAALQAAQENLASDERKYRVHVASTPGAARLSCPATEPTPAASLPTTSAVTRLLVANYAASCNAFVQKQKDYAQAIGGLGGAIGQVHKELSTERARLQTWKSSRDALDAKYRAALKAYEDAKIARVPAAAADLAAKLKSAQDALQDLTKAAKGAPALPGNPAARLAELDARYDGVVKAVTRMTSDVASKDPGAEVFVSTTLKMSHLQSDEALPALLLEAERLRGQRETAAASLEHAERRTQLLQLQHDALLDELQELKAAREALPAAPNAPAAPAPPPPSPGKPKPEKPVRPASECMTASATVIESHRKGDPACRERIATALLHYANSFTAGEVRVVEARRMQDANLHDEAIDHSAAAMREWEALLSIPVEEVVEYHATGVKPEDLARILVEAAGLTVIGAAVVAK
jgi:hypothetical protein